MAAPIGTWSHPKAMWPGVKTWFGVGYGEHKEEYRVAFEVVTSDKAWEEDVQHNAFGLMNAKVEGKPTTYQGQTQGPVSRYTHTPYSSGFIVTFEEMLNNLYETVSGKRAKSLGFAKRQTVETLGALVYNRAFNDGYVGGDGVELLATDHPFEGGDFSNELDPSGQ